MNSNKGSYNDQVTIPLCSDVFFSRTHIIPALNRFGCVLLYENKKSSE